jgi:cold shock CspA family protein
MRTHGTLARWNDDRGFGFIACAQGGDEVFVHVSAFPRDGTRPRVGELVSFEIEAGGDGKRRAVHVLRPGSKAVAERRSPRASPATRRNPLAAIAGLLAIGAIGAYGYSTFASRPPAASSIFPTPATPATPAAPDAPAAPAAPAQQVRCDGRTQCSQMTSCAEAVYFLQNCPGTTMDGNNDGEPCEQQWCN